jgi:hypothetical protein
MTIKEDIKSMFWEPAIDYANTVEPITFETDEELPAQQERWDLVHKAYGKGVEDVIDFVMANYKLKVIVPVKKETEEETRLKLRDSFEYHDMCARATLHPGKSIDDVKQIHLNRRIEDTYKFVNEILLNTTPMNTPETRRYVVDLIQKRIEYNVIVRCNEENNPPDVIDQNLLIAELLWNVPYDSKGPQMLKSVLVFGNKIDVENYNFQNFLDNETFKFIQKGI